MQRINVSLPEAVKRRADKLVQQGHYSSFSELVRVGLRAILKNYEEIEKLKSDAKDWKRFDRSEDEHLL